MKNAKQEFLEQTQNRQVKCACVQISGLKKKTIFLRKNFTQEDLDEFLDQLDFEYNENSLHLLIEGTIWYKDNDTWSERHYIDDEQVWTYHKMPQPPRFLL